MSEYRPRQPLRRGPGQRAARGDLGRESGCDHAAEDHRAGRDSVRERWLGAVRGDNPGDVSGSGAIGDPPGLGHPAPDRRGHRPPGSCLGLRRAGWAGNQCHSSSLPGAALAASSPGRRRPGASNPHSERYATARPTAWRAAVYSGSSTQVGSGVTSSQMVSACAPPDSSQPSQKAKTRPRRSTT